MKKTIFITFAVIFLLAIMPATFSTYEIPNWYAVEDWELDVCSKWGGTAEAQSGSATSNIYLSQLTVSLQAEKTAFPDNTTLYEVSYYIQPITDNVEFSVWLKNTLTGDKNNITQTASASPLTGASGFNAFYSTIDYDVIQLGYKESPDSLIHIINVSVISTQPPAAPQTCEDGTAYEQCSATQPKYCENGNLINKCSSCSCPSGQSCQADGSCIGSAQTCADSDGGLNYYALGDATGVGYTGEVNTLNDGCIIGGLNDGWLREAVCKDNIATWSDYNCPNGCNDGVCMDVTPACADGTLYSQCSATQPKYCDSGSLIDKCSACGCPSGQTCQNEESCVGPDTTQPTITDVLINPTSGLAGTMFTITTKVTDSSGISSVNAYIQNPDETNIATVSLYDDGAHGDSTANDGIYGNVWDSTGAVEIQYYIDITAQDKASNNAEVENAANINILSTSFCKTVIENGDHESKIDVVFLANGYSEDQLATFASVDVPYHSEVILYYEPFSQNRQKFNIYYVDKAYDTSCDHGNTACETDALELASLCPFYDQIIVLTNYYHRSWASYGVGLAISVAEDPLVTTHEFGHSFGGLADEYTEEGRTSAKDRPNCDVTGCPKWCDGAGANCIAGAGCYKGCTIEDDYRSSENSIMNHHNSDDTFNVVSINHLNKIFACCYPSSQEESESVDCAKWNSDNSLRYASCFPVAETYLFKLEDLSEAGFDITKGSQTAGTTTVHGQETYYYYTYTPAVSINVEHGELAKDDYESEVSSWRSEHIIERDEYGDKSLRVNYESSSGSGLDRGQLYILKSQTFIHFNSYSLTDEDKINKLAEIGVGRVQ